METGSRPDTNQNPGQAPGTRVDPAVERRPASPGQGQAGTGYGSGAYAAPPPRKRRTWIWVLLAAIVIVALIWFFLVPHGGASQSAAGGRHGGRGGAGAGAMPTTVSVAQAQRGDMPIYLNELGAVTPLATVTVQSQISGYLQSLGFNEGQLVTKGQFLAQVDPRPYQAALLQAQGALARDEAALAEARLDLKRYQLLLSQDSIARQQVDLQAATVKQDMGTVKTDQAAVATAKLNLAYTHITSPVTGRVGLRQVDVGNYVTSGLTNGIVVVTQLTPIDVEFTLPEDNLPQIVQRLHAGATLPVVAYDRSGVNQLATGHLLTLDNVVDPNTGTVKAKARFENGAGTLFPQQFVNVRVLVDSLSNTVLAPTSAVLRGPNGLFVYVVQGATNNHTVTVRQVKTGPADATNTSVVSGLNAGETVVTDGTDRLREGAKVILPGDCIPSFPQGGAGKHGGHKGGHAGGAQDGNQTGAANRGGCPAGEQREGKNAAPQGGQTAAGFGSGGSQDQSGSPSSSGQAGGNQTGSAQTGSSQAGSDQGGPGPGGRMQAMLSQLNLDPQQQLKAQGIFLQARGQAMAAAANAGDDPDARRNAMRQAFSKAFDQLEPILRPDQKAKLAQVRAQMAQGHGGAQGGGQASGDQ